MSKWYERAKLVTKEKEITIRSLANHLGLSSSTISNYLSGKTDPSVENFSKIAEFLDVQTSYLLYGSCDENLLDLKQQVSNLKHQIFHESEQHAVASKDLIRKITALEDELTNMYELKKIA